MADSPSRIAGMSKKRLTLLALDLQHRLERNEQALKEPLAIVGMGCRLPGAQNLNAYWQLLSEGREAVTEIPGDRWSVESYYSSDPEAPGKMYTRHGNFIENPYLFDPQFFGISPREATSMDPQQRLLLEVTWEALEDAFVPPASLEGSRTGVFVGISTNDYLQYGCRYGSLDTMDAYMGTGCSPSVACGRLSYTLGTLGPSYSVDTACSSSLVAIHLACLSLRLGDCELAIAAGVNLMLIPGPFIYFSKLRALSPDGRCKTFDASANGYGRGEGCGVVVLKRLSDALAANDRIVAVIRGSAVNHDGRSNGLTVPSGLAQEAVIRDALKNAGVTSDNIGYVEAHGTGTPLGDPIELHALGNVLSGRTEPLLVGSVKTNFGHLEAAAGVAGIIKVALALSHREIPPHLHLRQRNPYVDWARIPIQTPIERTSFPQKSGRLLAGVSSFGFGGTNAHVVLEAAPDKRIYIKPERERSSHLLCLSAKTEKALRELVRDFSCLLTRETKGSFADLCYSVNVGRSHFDYRLTVHADDNEQCQKAIAAYLESRPSDRWEAARIKRRPDVCVAFIFSGQGSQYPGMGRELYETHSRFRETILECELILGERLGLKLTELLWGKDAASQELLHRTENTQPALFALECALGRLWLEWGVEPRLVMGHSVGEFAAACLAGVFTLKEGLEFVSARGLLMRELCSSGAMAAVECDQDTALDVLKGYEDRVSIASLNGPKSLVISGDHEAMDIALGNLKRRGIESKRLRVSHPFHSPLMDPMLDAFSAVANQVHFKPPRWIMISGLTGRVAESADITKPEYWVRQLRESVKFASGVRTLAERGANTFLEIGPKPVLLGMASQLSGLTGARWLPSLRPPGGDWNAIIDSLCALYLAGVDIDWKAFDAPYQRHWTSLPSYPFQRQRYRVDLPVTENVYRGADHTSIPEPVTDVEVVHDRGNSEWFYQVKWEVQPRRPETQDNPEVGRWLVFGSFAGAGGRLISALETSGRECILVTPGSSFSQLGASHWTIRSDQPNDYRLILDRLVVPTFAGVIHLWSVDETNNPSGLGDLESTQLAGYRSALLLTQALVDRGDQKLPRLFLITSGAQTVTDNDPTPAFYHAPIWGFGRVAAMEHPKLRCVLVDLDPATTASDQEFRWLAGTITSPERENQFARRKGQTYSARLVPRPDLAERVSDVPVKDGVWLITGGTGGIGMLIAQWLIERGVRKLALLSRNRPSEQLQAKIAQLTRLGAEIRFVCADVADPSDCARAVSEIRDCLGPIRAIIHGAGVMHNAALTDLDWELCQKVLRPKMLGAWNLHRFADSEDLDVFICFSSSSSILGSPGQGNYSPANAFLDAFSGYRRALGRPCLSINWGPWAGTGMAAQLTGEVRRRWDALGVYGSLEPEQGLDGFGRLLKLQIPQVAAMSTDWPRVFQIFPLGLEPPFLEALARLHNRIQPPTAVWLELLSNSTQARPEERYEILRGYLEKECALVLGLPEDTSFDCDQGFFELGMDSLMSVELRNRLQTAAGNSHIFPITVIFERPNIKALVAYLEVEVLKITAIPVAQTISLTRTSTEAVAIIGIGCRFPGGANDPETFWRNLRDGVDSIQEVPSTRWNVEEYFNPDPDAPGKMNSRFGGFIDDIDKFDAQFFGVSPREATRLDPQHRLLLETAWHTLENACQPVTRLKGSNTGIFVGISINDYIRVLSRNGDAEQIDAYLGTGNALSMASGRIAHFMGLQGPSISLDTACSSSLVAVHLACQSLRNGECNLALAGGVNAIFSPEVNVSLSKARMLSPDGRCKTFDAGADGYVRGEGCGMVALKRLTDAERDGDEILSIILGTAVNHDGRSSGLTVPNALAQEALIGRCLADARIDAHEIDYIEAHGTGTPLGDPIEMQSLGKVFGNGRGSKNPLLVGSVKTNIGHLESAAGIAGLIKAALSLHHGEIPASLNFRQPSPYIPWNELPIEVVTERRRWPQNGHPRRAGVSSFGFSGTNAHVILEQRYKRSSHLNASVDRPRHILCLSARSAPALKVLAERTADLLESDKTTNLGDVCYTANAGRATLNQRLAVVGTTRNEISARLRRSFEEARDITGLRPRIAFLFSGQGSQYVGMGRELFRSQSKFRDVILECESILGKGLAVPLTALLWGEAAANRDLLDRTENAQPALFALQYALGQLWRDWGVQARVAFGHSVGEYAAACLAGVLRLEDGLALIAARGRLMAKCCLTGSMAAIDCDGQSALEFVEGYENRVTIAAFNGPRNTVISGDNEAVDEIMRALKLRDVKCRPLKVSHAFHSPLMTPMVEEFSSIARSIKFNPPSWTLISGLTGRQISAAEITDPTYWIRHVSLPVQFETAMTTLIELGINTFLEIGPSSALLGMGKQIWNSSGASWVPSLRPQSSDWVQMLDSLRELYLGGVEVNWKKFDEAFPRQWTPLPSYPFQRQRFWGEAEKVRSLTQPIHVEQNVDQLTNAVAQNNLLGRPLRSPALPGNVYESRFSQTCPSFLDDHRIYSMIVVPGASHLSMVASAMAEIDPQERISMEDVSFQEVLVVPDDEVRLVQLVLTPKGNRAFDFKIHSSTESAETWLLHAAGRVGLGNAFDQGQRDFSAAIPNLEEIMERCSEELSNSRLWYQLMSRQGIQLGAQFQWVERLWRRDGEALGVLRKPRTVDAAENYVVHPGLLDSCFQLIGATLSTKDLEASAYIPISIERFNNIRRTQDKLYVHVNLRSPGADRAGTRVADLVVFSESGQLVMQIVGLRIHRAPRSALLRFAQRRLRDALYSMNWIEQSGTPLISDFMGRKWLVFAHEGSLAEQIEQKLGSQGSTAIFVKPAAAFDKISPSKFEIDPSDSENFHRLYREALVGVQPLAGVIFLWGANGSARVADADRINAAQESGCLALMRLVQVLARTRGSAPPRLVVATRCSQEVGDGTEPIDVTHAALWGLGRVIATEHPQLRCLCVDLDITENDDLNVGQLEWELAANTKEDQVAFRKGKRYVLRLGRFSDGRPSHQPEFTAGEAYQLERDERGVLDGLQVQPAERQKPGSGEIEIIVDATGLNFRDVLSALALYPGEAGPLGGECAGTVVGLGEGVRGIELGSRVMAIGAGTFSRFAVIDSRMAVPIPDEMTFAQAATIPVAFITAYYGLWHLAKIRRGDKVLIHAAAGGVGLAAIELAQHFGAEIYATAGSEEKRSVLRSLGVKQVFDSRSVDFAAGVGEATAGRGVDIVLNSLAGHFIGKSLEVTTKGGRFVELGKNNIWTTERMTDERPDVAYHTMALDELIINRPDFVGEMLRDVAEMIALAKVKLLPRTEFRITQVIESFRYMAQAKHVGKIVVSHGNEMATGSAGPPVSPDRTYVITGGVGGLGLVLARRLGELGARYLALIGRHPPSAQATKAIAELEGSGTHVTFHLVDVSDRLQLDQVLTEIRKSDAPLAGVFHLAGALDDSLLMRLDDKRFRTALDPKLLGALHLHELSVEDNLDYFVLFSSAASTLGTPGQSNYAAANSFLDALAHRRRQLGLAALSINWGPWDGNGMAAKATADIRRQWASMGISPFSPKTGLATLEMLWQRNVTQVVALCIEWHTLLKRLPSGMELPLIADLVQDRTRIAEPSADWLAFVAMLEKVLPSERKAMLVERFRQQTARVLGLDSAEKVDPRTPLNEIGLDSLMAVELANQLGATAGISLPVTQIFDYPTIEKLAEFFVSKVLRLDNPTSEIAIPQAIRTESGLETSSSILNSISGMSDEEVEARLKHVHSTGSTQ